MLEDGIVEKDVMQTIHVAFLCLQPNADLRPPMSQIVAMLVHKIETPTRPPPPPFLDPKLRIGRTITVHA